jgi:hypothetical protein
MHFSVYSYQHSKVYVVGTLEQCNSQATWFKYMIENEKELAPKKCTHNTGQWKVSLIIINYPKKCNGNA